MEKKEKELEVKEEKKEEKKLEVKEEKVEEKKEPKKVKEVKEKKKRKPINLFLLFILMLICFAGEEIALLFFSGIFMKSALYGRYGLDLIAEISAVILIVAIVFIFGQKYIFTEKKEKFWKSLLVGLPFVAFATFMLIFNAISVKFNMQNFVSLLFLTLCVGIYEELLCRGWLQNIFVRSHNTSRGKVILSIILSSLVFGMMHIVNVFGGQTLFETLMQILQATAMGFFLGAVYYRTKNIYAVMFMHFYWDLAVMIGEMNLLRDCTNGVVTNDIMMFSVVTSLLFSIVYTLIALYILRREKVAPLLDEPKEVKPNKFVNVLLPVMAIAAFVGVLFLKEPKGYADYETCYEYVEMDMGVSDLHYSQRTRYDIKEGQYHYELFVEDDGLVLKNVNTKDKIVLFEKGTAFEVIKEKDYYMLVTITLDDNNNQSVNYSMYMTVDGMSDDKSYLENVKKSFEGYVIPDVEELGYLTNDGTDFKYPLMTTMQNNSFVIDQEGFLFLVNFTDEEYEKKEEVVDPLPELIDDLQNDAVDPMAESEEIVGSGITEVQIEETLDMVFGE